MAAGPGVARGGSGGLLPGTSLGIAGDPIAHLTPLTVQGWILSSSAV